MRAAAVGLGIPADAFAVEVAAPAVDLANLHSKQRPLRAGFRTTGFFTQDGVEREKACTQGPNVTYDNAKHYVVNAHCTEHDTKNGYIGAAFYQPVVGRYNHAGDEVIDVAYNWFTGCPTGSLCRYSDAALVRVPGALFPWEIAAIGKPQVRVLLPGDSGSMDILDADPKFTLTGVLSALFVGDTLEKVGSKTGWTAGVVESTCVDQATSGSPYVQLCNIRVAAGAGGGDSGSPVFFKSTSGTYHLAGLLWGGLLVPGSEKGVTFFASNWRYVSIELGGSMYALDPINPPSTDPPCEPPNPC